MNKEPSQHIDIAPLLATATRHHKAGRLAEAEAMYQEILKKYPDQPDALQFLGLIAHNKNDSQTAINLFRKAISINPFSIDYYVNLGTIYKQLGRLRDALECYQTALQLQPDNAETYNNLGNIYKEQGRMELAKEAFEKAISIKPGFSRALNNIGLTFQSDNHLDDAEKYYRKALNAEPEYVEAHNNLGNVLMATGKPEEATECFQTALKLSPNYLQAHFNLGNLYASRGNFKDAETYYRNSLNIKQDFFDALFNLGRILHRYGNLEEALELLLKAQTLRPQSPAIYHQTGQVLYDLNRHNEAIDSYNKAIRLKPDFADAYYNQGNAYYGVRRYQDAVTAFQKAIELKPQFSEAYNNLGNVYTEMGKIDDGESALRKALELRPEYDAAYNNLGNIYKQRGKSKEAIECYNKALSITPDYPEAHRHLALTTKYKPNNLKHAEQIKSALKKENLSDREKMHLHFALGKIYDDCQMAGDAFHHYQIANDLRYKEMGFDIEKHARYIDQLIAVYSDKLFKQRLLFGHDSTIPVLIVGMPRSGTTLVEQIISSHPKAAAAGELVAIHQMEVLLGRQLRLTTPYPENAKLLDERATINFANEYIRYLRSFSADAERITDKMPDNFLSLGFIHLLFPKAHIIHCKRNPLDTCLSIYFQFFVQANGYAYDLKTLGQYYNEYRRIMAHWRNSKYIKMYEVQYENLVNNQEKISRELIEYIGLDWDDNCIEFHKNKRPVRTASSDQVRKPMYSSSIDRWKSYEAYLGPLIETLNLDNKN